jgi:hypothetical protein
MTCGIEFCFMLSSGVILDKEIGQKKRQMEKSLKEKKDQRKKYLFTKKKDVQKSSSTL